jgi:hypothetical protein
MHGANLIDFFGWFAAHDEEWRQRPWLVLGKGPSFSLLDAMDTSVYHTFGLNHVVLETRVDIAHAIDIDVVEHCAQVLPERAGHLAMPWVPHVRNKPGARTLPQWIELMPVLAELAAQGRLLWYNKTGSRPHCDSPVVRVMRFSAEAPYALLGMAGARTIRSLGIDGGASYANSFQGLPTLLANRRDSFDSQFDEIARSVSIYGLDAAPLNVPGPVRIYVAATEEQALSVKVLEYSIRKHASMSVQVMPLYQADIPIPQPRDLENRPRTPFSFQRFLIPQIAGDAGRAIYLDSDMQVMTDIRGLWEKDMQGMGLVSVAPAPGSGRRPQYSVMLLDCGRLRWRIDAIVHALDEGRLDYEGLMQRMAITQTQAASIEPEWNSLEQYIAGKTKLVHYTDMDTQPWVYAMHPFGHVWVRYLIEAVESGFISLDEIREHIARGYVRPSLEHQVEHRIPEAVLLPRKVLALDRHFLAPYRRLAAPGRRNPRRFVKALAEARFKSLYMSLRKIKRALMHAMAAERKP